ncbi:hypothetical protein [Crateriforma conspicua]|uniref:Ankyrin repeats (3 copies) n=1 Tax=Crateriforma conspicua TaxID=2527996 RepID=A0A5C5Y9D3_9PLAN|nr:hypothetical protein [Crateriforma conspicua]QDV61459.1 hypothetical protein Mal65_05820 [Crateriforma conspicua]TWT72296.1 hypothetical protein Pan14r_46160 [Crateriforma conspicua]
MSPKIYCCEDVRSVRRLYADLLALPHGSLPIVDLLRRQADLLLRAHRSADGAVTPIIRSWHPRLVGCSVEQVFASELSLQDMLETVAREHGFSDWSQVDALDDDRADPMFETAVDAVLAGDIETLRSLFNRSAGLPTQRSRYGHRSTLLHYVGANGVETHRQVVPMNLAEVTRVLLQAGADADAGAEMYGGGCTALMLLRSSAHPKQAGLVDRVAELLEDASPG